MSEVVALVFPISRLMTVSVPPQNLASLSYILRRVVFPHKPVKVKIIKSCFIQRSASHENLFWTEEDFRQNILKIQFYVYLVWSADAHTHGAYLALCRDSNLMRNVHIWLSGSTYW